MTKSPIVSTTAALAKKNMADVGRGFAQVFRASILPTNIQDPTKQGCAPYRSP